MPMKVEPKVYLIGQTKLVVPQATKWLADHGVTETGLSRLLTQDNAEQLIELCGRRCYLSFEPGLNPNVTKIRADSAAYLTNILKVGHGSVLEHASFTLALENVSRVFTAEMNRHRAGMAISEGSMRYIRFDRGIPYWEPTSIRDATGDTEEVYLKKAETRRLLARAFEQADETYQALAKVWANELAPESTFATKKQLTSMMRRVIPIGVATGGVWSGNVRALRHVFTMRCAKEAEEEICHVATLMLQQVKQAIPNLLKDFKPDGEGYWRPEFVKV